MRFLYRQLVRHRDVKYGRVDTEKLRKRYIKEKIQLLEEFGIKLTDEQDHLIRQCKDEMAVDRFARDLIMSNSKG